MRKFLLVLCLSVALLHYPRMVSAQVESLPLLRITDLAFEGAFRLPADTFGSSSLNFSEGPLAYNSATHSLFIVGHSHHQEVAEFAVPALVRSSELAELNFAASPLQGFSAVLSRASTGNPQNINRIGGLHFIDTAQGRHLFINGYEYYDAAGDNSHTTLVLRTPQGIESSLVEGYFSFAARAHASGWISSVPGEWQGRLAARYLSGSSSGIPIIGRTSVGPSAFVFDERNFENATSGTIPTTALLDFSLAHPLHADLSNSSGNNELWTHLSRAVYGFIPRNSRSYVTLGHSGGHRSGVCYKCTQNDGNTCGGYCAPDANDYSHYYWLWDLNELLAVKAGAKQPHEIRPYAYGVFSTPFPTKELGGGSYDPNSGLLYLSAQRADIGQGRYSNPPVIMVYRVSAPTSPRRRSPSDFDADGLTDPTVIRGDGYAQWYSTLSGGGPVQQQSWGIGSMDVFLDLDLNGDGRTEYSAIRAKPMPEAVPWYLLLSGGHNTPPLFWGIAGDLPLSADFDGDARSDISIFRSADGSWWSRLSGGSYLVERWGLPGDYPLAADFDGDTKDDLAIWRPSTGMWAVSYSSKAYSKALEDILWVQWGLPGDFPMSGDYDGDGRADLMVWREAWGLWFLCGSRAAYDCSGGGVQTQFGLPGDLPVHADFDGDGVLDLSVWRPSNGVWFWKQSSDATIHSRQWGLPKDRPLGVSVRALFK